MHKTLAIALALAVALPAAADDDTRARRIAPFLDEQTLAVARLDLTTVNADALVTAFGPFDGIDTAGAKSLHGRIDRWLADFTRAGGRELYAVFSLADAGNGPFVVVPLREGADAKAIASLLNFGMGPFASPGEKRGEVVVAGGADVRQRLRSLKPVARPELARAFAAAGDGAAQVALIPPPHLPRVIDEMMPVLPREIGGGSSKALTRGVKWAALGLGAPPKVALRLTAQSADAEAAKALRDTLGKALKALGEAKALPDFDKIAAALAPKVEEDRLVLALDEKETLAVLNPLVRRAVRVAAQNQAAAHLRDLTIALISHADAHKGRLPAAAIFDKAGKPLLSWRVQVLPYIGEEKLYKEFRLDEPWDSDHNKKLIARMPAVFRGPSRALNDSGKTVYLAPVGKELAFTGSATGRLYPAEFTDGTANTILLVQADDAHAVEWTRPEDLKVDAVKPHEGLGRQVGDFTVGLADGSVRFLRPTISKETLRAAFTPAGNEILGADWD